MAKKAVSRCEATLRRYALSFPETHEDFPWGHRAIKVRNKAFVFMGIDDAHMLVTVKLPVSAAIALTLSFAEPTGYGLGRSGWVTARFGTRERVPMSLLEEWIEESYRAVAPKKLVKRK